MIGKPINVQKKKNVVLKAYPVQLHDGDVMSLVDDRGVEQPVNSGDWIMETSDGRRWPVDADYFYDNYEQVEVVEVEE